MRAKTTAAVTQAKAQWLMEMLFPHIGADLRGALVPVVSENYASLTDPPQVGALLRAIDGYEGQPITAGALKLASLVFVRPGELRGARWAEFDLDGTEWRIPAAHEDS